MTNPATLEHAYQLNVGANLLLTIAIGNAQMGVSAVWIDDVLHSKGAFTQTNLGNGAELNGKSIRIKTLVLDVISFTNKMAVTFKLEGGPAPFSQTVPWEVPNNGDTAVFRAVFPVSN